MVKTKELFSDDLGRIELMLAKIAGQLRSFSDQLGWPSSQQQIFELLFTHSLKIVSSLFEPLQRAAWTELGSPELRHKLELRLLGHLRDCGLLLAGAIERPLERSPWREANVFASITVIPRWNLGSNDPSAYDEMQSLTPSRQFQASSSTSAYYDTQATELKVHLSVLKELASTAGE